MLPVTRLSSSPGGGTCAVPSQGVVPVATRACTVGSVLLGVLPSVKPSVQPAQGGLSAEHATGWDLIGRAQQGDTEAFGELYDRYVDVVFRYVLFRVGDRSLAEDVTSETFLRALRGLCSVSYQGRDVAAWLVTIARNIVLDHLKSSRHRLEIATAEVTDPPVRVGADVSGPEQQVLLADASAELRQCIAQLKADQRECIVLRFMQGLSVAETAAVMGRNVGAVKALQHRAVRRLAQLLPRQAR